MVQCLCYVRIKIEFMKLWLSRLYIGLGYRIGFIKVLFKLVLGFVKVL